MRASPFSIGPTRMLSSGIVVPAEPGAPAVPVNTVLPAITGTAQVDETLTVSDGTWTIDMAKTYQWRRITGGTPTAISGATASTYTLVEDDEGKDIDCAVTNGGVTAYAVAVGPVAAAWTPAALFAGETAGGWYERENLFQDSAGTTPVESIEDPIGLRPDLSALGPDAIQTTSGERPALSARFNEFANSAFEGGGSIPTGWDDVSGGTGTSAPDGTIDGNTIYKHTASSERPYFGAVTPTMAAGSIYTASMYVDEVISGTIQVGQILAFTNATMSITTAYSINGEGVGGSTEVSSGDRIALHITVGETAGSGAIRVGLGVLGNRTGEIRFSRVQLEVGAQASRYQRIDASGDYDHEGFPRYVRFDAGTSLDIAFGDLGSDCTIARAVPGIGAQILAGQTISGGWADDVPNAGLVIVDRALVGSEESDLAAYLEGLLVDNPPHPVPIYDPQHFITQKAWADTGGHLSGPGGTYDILKVTNTNPSGPGSLRAALEASGARLVVFETSGVIDLDEGVIIIDDPYITVAGQTAPSPGVAVVKGLIEVRTTDVIISHVWFGVGRDGGSDQDCLSTLSANRVILDHCSFFWGRDGNVDFSGYSWTGSTVESWRANTSRNITMTGCIIAEHLDPASGKANLVIDNATGIFIARNAYINSAARLPQLNAGVHAVVANNLTWNPRDKFVTGGGSWSTWQSEGATEMVTGKLDMIGNIGRAGENSGSTVSGYRLVSNADVDLYYHDNEFRRQNNTLYPDTSVSTTLGEPFATINLSEVPVLPGHGASFLPSGDVESWILVNVGPRPWDRMPHDTRVLADYTERNSQHITTHETVGGYPSLAANTRTFDAGDWDVADPAVPPLTGSVLT